MARIVAIGGGEIARPGSDVDTADLDAEVVRLSGKRHPSLVFLPTASGDDAGYVAIIEEYYGRRLGCRIRPLTLFDRSGATEEIERVIAGADIVYVGGGNTLRMMKLWRRRGVDRLLTQAAEGGTVLAGISAGAICWCTAGVSDSRSFTAQDDTWPYIAVRGLGLVDVLLSPHHDADPRRQDGLRRLVGSTRRVGVGLDDCTALEVVDDRYRILSCRRGGTGHRVERSSLERDLPPHDDFRPLTELV